MSGRGRKRSPDFEIRRSALIAAAEARLSTPPDRPTFAILAEEAGVTVSTLKHYFGDRTRLVAAVLEEGAKRGQPFMARAAQPEGPFEESVPRLLHFILDGHNHGRLGALHIIGLVEGAVAPNIIGTAYLDLVLNPAIEAAAKRLAAHQQRGEMMNCDPKLASTSLITPLVMLLFHQDYLGGRVTHPLSAREFVDRHAQSFVAGHKKQ